MPKNVRFASSLRRGADAYANQLDSDKIRSVFGTYAAGSCIGPTVNEFFGVNYLLSAGYSLGQSYLVPLKYQVEAIDLARATCGVSTFAAGTLDACLYALTGKSPGAVSRIPLTSVTFDCSTVNGRRTQRLSTGSYVPAETLVYLGFRFLGAAPTMSACTCSENGFACVRTTTALVGLPDSADLAFFDSSLAGAEVPIVSYLGPALEVL